MNLTRKMKHLLHEEYLVEEFIFVVLNNEYCCVTSNEIFTELTLVSDAILII